MKESLLDIAKRLDSSKWNGHSYIPIYEELFAHWRDEPIEILELGVHECNSMHLWIDYFTKAIIHGLDAGHWEVFDPRLRAYQYDQRDPKVGKLFVPGSLRFIIDDASHNPLDQHGSFGLLWSAVTSGGYYIIEDIHRDHQVKEWIDHEILPMFNDGVSVGDLAGWRVYANHENGRGHYRDDDILLMLKKK